MVKKTQNENAVSPVIGVMLMLVVTIIIAAVVSMFASGMLTDTDSPTTVKINYVGLLDGELGERCKTGLVFENVGGDDINLQTLTLTLKNGQDEVSINYLDFPSYTIATEEPIPVTETRLAATYVGTSSSPGYRMAKVGATANGIDSSAPSESARVVKLVSNCYIRTGDRFIILVDKYVVTDGARFSSIYLVAERGDAENPYSSGLFEVGPNTTYTLVDETSGRIIASGSLSGTIL